MVQHPTSNLKLNELQMSNTLFSSKLFPNVPLLPKGPTGFVIFARVARPKVEGKQRSFLPYPFWKQIYEDNSSKIMIIGGRQIFKSTYCTDRLAYLAATNAAAQIAYVTYDEANLATFSTQKFRKGCLKQNQLLKQLIHGPRLGNKYEVNFKNDSVVYLVTDESQYIHVEGKSPIEIILDESQHQDLQFLDKLYESMATTQGKIKILGIGGEAGSDYERLWLETNQMEWIYDNPDWRDKLRFDENGLVVSNYLRDVLKGKWIPQNPDGDFNGYHLPQTIFAHIPLTREDAVNKYRIDPVFSIEAKKKKPSSFFAAHVMGTFYKSDRRPITPQMVRACMDQYRYVSLLKPEEVRKLKEIYQNEIRVCMGVDFGSSPSASATAISIIIHWRKSDRYQLAWIEKRPQENQLDQAQYIAKLGHDYQIDYGVGDLGYGQNQVKVIQDGGYDSNGNQFRGLGKRKFVGCRTTGDETKPQMEYKQTRDEHGTQTARIQIDKTTSIQQFIDFVGSSVQHPRRDEKKCRRSKFMIPFKNDYETDWLIPDFCSITRKDLEQVLDTVKEDPRQKARKEFNHPSDSVMSIIYALVADKNYDPCALMITRLGRRW